MKKHFRHHETKKWYVLKYKPKAHLRAMRNLTQQGFETFLPLHSVTSSKGSSFIKKECPLFPGYMFITFDSSNTNWVKINNTYGVSRLITFNSILKSVPNSFINKLANRCDQSGRLITEKNIKIGDKVKFLNGPFADFIASVETLESDQRIWTLMDLMGQETKIEVKLNDLQILN